MKKGIRIILCILMSLSLGACTKTNKLTVDLSQVEFVSMYRGHVDALTEDNKIKLYPQESDYLKTYLQISKWTLVNSTSKTIPNSINLLFDQNGLTYYFMQEGNKMRITVVKTGDDPIFYEIDNSAETLINVTFEKVAAIATLKTDIRNLQMTQANSDNSSLSPWATFTLDKTL